MISILNLSPFSCSIMWSILQNVLCVHETTSILVVKLLDDVSQMFLKFIWSNMLLKSNLPLLNFLSDDLLIDESEVLKFPTIIISVSLGHLIFRYVSAPLLSAWILTSVLSSWWISPFTVIWWSSLFLYCLWFRVCLLNISIANSAFLVSICVEHCCHVQSTVSLKLKWGQAQHVFWSYYFFCLATLCFLIEEFSLFTFKLIIDMHWLTIATLFISGIL